VNEVNSGWYEVVIPDPDLLSGSSVRRFLEPLITLLGLHYVLLKDLDGAIPGLSAFEGALMTVSEFTQRVEFAGQYDWAFFHFYMMRPTEIKIADDITRIRCSDLTVRLTDGSYFYIYSKNLRLLEKFKIDYADSDCVFIDFNKIDIPY
jgi:hypothetical protein